MNESVKFTVVLQEVAHFAQNFFVWLIEALDTAICRFGRRATNLSISYQYFI